MNGYFKPLQRKLGVITLVMACAFAVGWFRSQSENDTVAFRFHDTAIYEAISKRGTVCFQHKSGPLVRFGTPKFFTSSKFLYPPSNIKFDDHPFQGCRDGTKWRWKWGGFDIGKGTESPAPLNLTAFQIPYWSIVLPLTILTTWLLLSRPRPATRA